MPRGVTLGEIAQMKPDVAPGWSPDLMEDIVSRLGGPEQAMSAILAARMGEASANPQLRAMTPEQRAQLDRYANFAVMAQNGGNPIVRAANYLGGMGAMAATEAFKAIPGANTGASAAWNTVTGNPGGQQFFGGSDVSEPSLANIAAAHWGYVREPTQR